MGRLLISAAHKSSGKTTVSIGLCAALTARNLRVASFKKGPDYIDPLWLSAAAGRPCLNLDFNVQDHNEIRREAARHAEGGDIALIEGNKGLFDGVDPKGSDSNAALARLLETPIILVIDCTGMTRGIAPLLLGYRDFESNIQLAGVILNKVAGPRHEDKLRTAIETYTNIPILGAVHRHPDLSIHERHLGLIPANEDIDTSTKIEAIAHLIGQQVDLDALLDIARMAPALADPAPLAAAPKADLRIGVARDQAFSFLYPGDLEAFEVAGADIVFLDMIGASSLPELDGLFLSGGFPETHADALSANVSLMRDVRRAINVGLPCYAECGGLMYLSRSLSWQGKTVAMAGVIPGDTIMGTIPQGRGYTRLKETGNGPWSMAKGYEFPAHEFHYSRLENLDGSMTYAYEVLRGHGIDGDHDGLMMKNLLASYCHLRHVATNPWVDRFTDFVRRVKQSSAGITAMGETG